VWLLVVHSSGLHGINPLNSFYHTFLMRPEQTHVAPRLQCPLLLDSYHSKTITLLACSSGSSSTTLHFQLLNSYWYSSTNPSQCSVHFTTAPPANACQLPFQTIAEVFQLLAFPSPTTPVGCN